MICIIDYKAGNAASVLNAVLHEGFDACLASDAAALKSASHIILPGVGSARATLDSLRDLNLTDTLYEVALTKKTPFLGICVGLQILFERSEEGDVQCLGWLKGRVVKFDAANVRVPQMGWNEVSLRESPLNRPLKDYFYFVNSYRAFPENDADIWGTADYDGVFAAAVRHENIYAAQFHVEKSGPAGLALLRGFLTC